MRIRKKKGATFLEVIISVAIIAILVIPISDLIMSSVRNNKNAEKEQDIKLLGQSISEKLKVSDIIKITKGASTSGRPRLQRSDEKYHETVTCQSGGFAR